MTASQDNQLLIDKTAEFVKQKFIGEGSGHDWWHIYRVWQNAKHIANHETKVDKTVVELGALLHDIADWKFTNGDLEAGPQAARAWLGSIGADERLIAKVEDIVRNTSFKGAKAKHNQKTIEVQIVSDADKLDAIGAIGIARCFAYSGSVNRPIHDPDKKPTLHKNFEEYKNNQSSAINHFYEKLLLLADMMHTKTGKELAKRRHEFMEEYLAGFYKEWEGAG